MKKIIVFKMYFLEDFYNCYLYIYTHNLFINITYLYIYIFVVFINTSVTGR